MGPESMLKETVKLDYLTLDFTLHVPNFFTNLLSVSRLTKSLNCLVTFFSTSCVFQDLRMRQTIRSGHGVRGLYLLDMEGSSSGHQCSLSLNNVCVSDNSSESIARIMLWHVRLGHLSFISRKNLFMQYLSLKESDLSNPCFW